MSTDRLCALQCSSLTLQHQMEQGASWSWSYGSWIYNYLCNQCLLPLQLWVGIPLMARCTQCNIMWYSLSVTSRWFSPGTSTNKTGGNNITEICLKVALIAITLTPNPNAFGFFCVDQSSNNQICIIMDWINKNVVYRNHRNENKLATRFSNKLVSLSFCFWLDI